MLGEVKTSNAPGQDWSEASGLLVIWQTQVISFRDLSDWFESKYFYFLPDPALSP